MCIYIHNLPYSRQNKLHGKLLGTKAQMHRVFTHSNVLVISFDHVLVNCSLVENQNPYQIPIVRYNMSGKSSRVSIVDIHYCAIH